MSIDADEDRTLSPKGDRALPPDEDEGQQPTRPLPLRARSAAGTATGPQAPSPRASGGWPHSGGGSAGERAVRAARAARDRTRDWFAANTFVPTWAPARFRRPAFGYLVAILLQVAAVALMLLLTGIFGDFAYQGAAALLATALVALNWGAAPAVVAAIVGDFLISYVVLPPRFSFTPALGREVTEFVLLLAAGVVISILASQTERERRVASAAAAHLADERARLDAIIEAAPDMISIHDARGDVVRLNRAGHDVFGETGAQVAMADRPSALDLIAPDGSRLRPEALPVARALNGEEVPGVEFRARLASGRDRLLEVSAAPFRDARGTIIGAVAISRDLTIQRRLEREVAERAGQIQATFDAMVDGVVVYDADGAIVQMNAAAHAIFDRTAGPGFSERPIEQRTRALQILDDQDRAIPPEDWPGARILRGETLSGLTAMEVRFPTEDGSELWLSISGNPVRGPDGAILGGIAIYHDVTVRRRLERRIYDALLALLTVATTLVEAPDEARPEGERVVARRLLDLTQRVLGCDRLGLNVLDPHTDVMHAMAVAGLPPEQERRWWAEQEELERKGARFSDSPDQEVVARMRAGEAMTFDMTKPPYDAAPNPYGIKTLLAAPMTVGDELVGLITYDYGGADHVYTPSELALAGALARLAAIVLERERLLREREEARASAIALQRANERMDEFLGIASHELKTPLTTVKANVQLSLRRLDRLDPDTPEPREEVRRMLPAKGLLERAERQVDRLDRLVGDLLDVSRIRAGKLELRPELTDLAAVVRDAVQEQRQSWPKRAISLDLPAESALATVDADRVGQVVTNYLTNALKYSRDDAHVAVTLAGKGDVWRVSVRDRGPGIPADELPHIWERFHRVRDIEVQSGSGVGLGLGLHISKSIVERQGGAVGVESTVGEGSEFWFTLPAANEAGSAATAEPAS